jgi:hypothetical protein
MEEITQPKVEIEATPADSTPAPEETTPFMQVKYNKEEVALDQEQATTYAQKGMNYDKIKESRDEIQSQYDNDGARKYIQSLAEEHNLTPDQALAKLNNDRATRLATKQGITPEAYQANQQIETLKGENAGLQKYKDTADDQAKVNALLETETAEFQKAHPDDQITEEMLTQWGKGFDMETSFQQSKEHTELIDLRKRFGIETANDENAAASTGRIGSQVDGHVAELNRESIGNMTTEQLDKNHNKVWEFLTGVKKE